MLRDLTSHSEWADAAVWTCVLEQPELLYEPKVRFWLHHVHTVQHAFYRLWTGGELDLPELSDFDDAESLARWGREAHAAIRRFHQEASADDLAKVLDIPWADRLTARFGTAPGPVTVEESTVQVALHTVHHRGQVAARISGLGGTPPLVDFIAWLWLGRPAAAWP
jgi:uncharacterized damage-inducible protein DinB